MKMSALVVWSSLCISGADLVRKKTTVATGIIFSAILIWTLLGLELNSEKGKNTVKGTLLKTKAYTCSISVL